jgi:hypothetical protein
LEKATKEFDREFAADTFAPMTPAQRRRWIRSRKPGRPRKPAGEKSVRVLITMDPALLLVLDKAARGMGIGRSTLIARALGATLGKARSPGTLPRQKSHSNELMTEFARSIKSGRAH